ncbi:hypothetical protein [Bacillus cereus]|uniref:hypothetical protein n=1 Tax=Bacillus cereus TaxID=1396 RepID=UPI00027AB7F9|nr:hypothetical protein [Bacillus cereus]EJS63462.1 hypothetical protein ICY_05299 [Bacillus cereus BAG2X1-3]
MNMSNRLEAIEKIISLREESKAFYRAYEITLDECMLIYSEQLDTEAVQLEVSIPD